ncbi:MAG: serine/threonine protein kinase, partial [Bdellovibrionales bacterium]|nr:serine/threonine protein kinase [Bdellovibrionales bacterium]
FFCVTDKVGGRHSTELAPPQQRTLGRLLARVHNIGTSIAATQRLRLTPQTYGWDNVAYLLNSPLLPDHTRIAYQSVVEPLLRIADASFQQTSLIRLHGDCHLGNVLWNEELPTLLDFDDMLFGPSVQDIWLVNPGRDDASRKRQEELLEGYNELRNFNMEELRLIEILRALRIIHFEAWIAKRWEDPSFQRTFPHFGSNTYWREELAALTEVGELLHR